MKYQQAAEPSVWVASEGAHTHKILSITPSIKRLEGIVRLLIDCYAETKAVDKKRDFPETLDYLPLLVFVSLTSRTTYLTL